MSEGSPSSVCPKCGKRFPEGPKFCDADGTRLVPPEKMIPRCIVCGTAYADGSRFCPRDGGAVIPEALRESRPSPFDTGRKLSAEELEREARRDYAVRIGDWLRAGWAAFREDPGGFVGITALFFAVTGLLSHAPMAGVLIGPVLAPLWAGLYIVAIMVLSRRKTEFADFFKGYNHFLPLLLAGLVGAVFIAAGIALLVVPGIYLAVGYVFSFLLIVDRRMDFWQALELSRKVVTTNWFSVFGFLLTLLLLNIGGAILLLVGLLVTFPVSCCAVAAAYRDIFGIESVES